MIAALVVVLLCALVSPEPSWSLQGGTIHPKRVPTVTFTWSWSTANPPYYAISITPMGSVTYESFPTSDQKTGNPYVIHFEASSGARTRIFALVQQLNFFRAQYKLTHNPNPVFVSKSLTYSSGLQRARIIYTTTRSRRIRELTNLFERMSATINTRRKLESMRSGNSNGLQPELKELQNTKKKLIEPQILIPTLQEIASDANAPQAARQEAQSVLDELK